MKRFDDHIGPTRDLYGDGHGFRNTWSRPVAKQTCYCGSGLEMTWQKDARGIELCKTCPKCHKEKMARYRPDVLTDRNYWADEAIDDE